MIILGSFRQKQTLWETGYDSSQAGVAQESLLLWECHKIDWRGSLACDGSAQNNTIRKREEDALGKKPKPGKSCRRTLLLVDEDVALLFPVAILMAPSNCETSGIWRPSLGQRESVSGLIFENLGLFYTL